MKKKQKKALKRLYHEGTWNEKDFLKAFPFICDENKKSKFLHIQRRFLSTVYNMGEYEQNSLLTLFPDIFKKEFKEFEKSKLINKNNQYLDGLLKELESVKMFRDFSLKQSKKYFSPIEAEKIYNYFYHRYYVIISEIKKLKIN